MKTMVHRFMCPFCREVLHAPGIPPVIPPGSVMITTYSTLGGSQDVEVRTTVESLTKPDDRIVYAHYAHHCEGLTPCQ